MKCYAKIGAPNGSSMKLEGRNTIRSSVLSTTNYIFGIGGGFGDPAKVDMKRDAVLNIELNNIFGPMPYVGLMLICGTIRKLIIEQPRMLIIRRYFV